MSKKLITIILFIILFFIIIYLFTDKKYYPTDPVELKYTRLVIKDNVLHLTNKKDNSLYTSYNMSTYESTIRYFKTTIKYILKEKNRKNILMLGFGLGGIPLKLSMDPKISRIDCVDIDNELFYYFKKLFPNHSKKINLYHVSADDYLQKNKIKYDIIIDDVFNGFNKIELDYLSLKKSLNKNGKLYMNNYDINNETSKCIHCIKPFQN